MKNSRRHFIRGMGGLALALPFMPSLMMPRNARASSMVIPKKFVAVCTYNGYMDPVYYPTVAPDHSFASDVFYKPFSEFPGPISEIFHSGYDSLKPKMNLYRGLDIAGTNDHDSSHMLCASGIVRPDIGNVPRGTSMSMDNILARSSNFYGSPPAFSALRGADGIWNYGMSFDRAMDGSAVYTPGFQDPRNLFQQVFGNLVLDPNIAAQFKAKKLTIGDMILDEYKALKNHRRISAADKIALDNFATQIQDLNVRINNAPLSLSCSKPGLRDLSTNYQENRTTADWEGFFSNYIDTMVTAMACDLTRVSVLTVHEWGYEHGLSHSDPNDRNNQLQYIQQFNRTSKVVLELANKMNSVIEADGTTMLDNSILFLGCEDSAGGAHGCQSMPAVSFGSAGGKLKTGYYMDYRTRPWVPHPDMPSYSGLGRGYNQLLITFMRALGLQPSDYMSYGDGGGFGLYDVNASYSNGHYNTYLANRNDTLPFIYNG